MLGQASSVHTRSLEQPTNSFDRGASMRTLIAGLWLALMLAIGTAFAQQAPFNETGVTMGHWHLVSQDVGANKKSSSQWAANWSRRGTAGASVPGRPSQSEPRRRTAGERRHSRVGDQPRRLHRQQRQEQVAKWRAAGVQVLPGNNNRLDQAFVVTPDGVRIEILEDKNQAVSDPAWARALLRDGSRDPEEQAWYAKTFGGKPGTRNNAPVVDVPGGQLRFARADTPQAPTRGRVLDHIGFDVKDLAGLREEDRGRRHQARRAVP